MLIKSFPFKLIYRKLVAKTLGRKIKRATVIFVTKALNEQIRELIAIIVKSVLNTFSKCQTIFEFTYMSSGCNHSQFKRIIQR